MHSPMFQQSIASSLLVLIDVMKGVTAPDIPGGSVMVLSMLFETTVTGVVRAMFGYSATFVFPVSTLEAYYISMQ